MNTVIITGQVHGNAERAFTGFGRSKLVFEILAQAVGDAEPTAWHCEIEESGLIYRSEPDLQAGRQVLLRAQLAGRPFLRNGVKTGFARYLKVMEVEGLAEAEGTEAGGQETGSTSQNAEEKA